MRNRFPRNRRTASHLTLLLAAVSALALGAPSAVMANGLDVFGMGARGSAMASASVSNASDYSAVYYNPAGMVLSESTAGLGVFYMFDNAAITLAPRPDGYDIPDLGPATPAIPTEYRLQERSNTEGLDSMFGIFLGVTTDFGLEKLRVGIAAFIPISTSDGSLSVFSDEREQYHTNQLHFDVVGNRIDHQVILFAVAYQVVEWLSLGAGFSFMPGAVFNSSVLVDNVTEMSDVDLNMAFTLKTSWRPNFGLLIFPDGPVRGGIAFRDEQSFVLTGVNVIQIRGFQDGEDFPIDQEIDLVLQYSPRQIIFGASWVPDGMTLALDVIFSMWSNYPNNHNAPAGWNNTWSPRLGFEAALGAQAHHLIRAGFAYEPTPVPDQPGRTNYVDNNRLIYSAGMEHKLTVMGLDFSLSWYVELQHLLERTFVKQPVDGAHPNCEEGVTVICDEVPDDSVNPETGDIWPEAAGLQTGNPGWPGYSSGGLISVLGVELSWIF